MTYPIRTVVKPSDLVSASNGKLPDELLVSIPFPGRGTGRLHLQAARSWFALCEVVLRLFGEVLTVTSWPDAYRSYIQQLSTFLTRYEPVSYATYLITSSARKKKWSYNGHTYWRLKPGYAMAATPGSSNHGWGLAIDACVLRGDGSIQALINSKCWTWLLEHAAEYGFSWESSESWHIRLYTGDATPQAVLDFEHHDPTSPIPPFDPVNAKWGLWPIATKPRIGLGATGDPVRYMQGVIFWKAGGNISIDGNFGPKTQARVKELQSFFNLTVDGWVGAQTWHTIDFLTTL